MNTPALPATPAEAALPATVPDAHGHCENCHADLHGHYCHECGQSVHSPIRHFGHAVEEFFEAFWHLDGRLFRTLRDLASPGRVAIAYLAGHRARYIAPLRLFVVLSVLTFFIGAASVHLDGDAVNVEGVDRIRSATTVAEVEALRDELVAGIEEARRAAGNTPGVDPALVAAQVRVEGAAATRIVELEGAPPDAPPPPAPANTTAPIQINLFGHSGPWHPVDNPLVVSWWPGFANDWLNRKVGRLESNLQRLGADSADAWVQVLMASVPSALFLLVPVFALLLKIAHLFTGRLYMEHLVVALYSHVFLLLMLSLAFVLVAVRAAAGHAAVDVLAGMALFAAIAVMPLYLLVMQKRVYRQPWWLTLPKFAVLGVVYLVILGTATALMFIARLAS
jgi:hypothetical protein